MDADLIRLFTIIFLVWGMAFISLGIARGSNVAAVLGAFTIVAVILIGNLAHRRINR